MGSFEYKIKNSIEERLYTSNRLLSKYSSCIPVIIEKSKDNDTPNISSNKYIIPKTLNISEIIILIRKKTKIDSKKAIFVFINNTLVPMNTTIGEIYDYHKDQDGFLYINYKTENTFG